MPTLNEISDKAHDNSKAKGFWTHATLGVIPGPVYHVPSADPNDGPKTVYNPSIVPEKLMLIVTEVAEAMEAFRDENIYEDHGLAEELADIIVRVGDLAAYYNIDLDAVVEEKVKKNAKRPAGHGRKRPI